MNTYQEALQNKIATLRKSGYDVDFHIGFNGIFSYKSNLSLSVEEFTVDEVNRFTCKDDPDDEAFVYAIRCKEGHQGILVNDYGTSVGPVSEAMVLKLSLCGHVNEAYLSTPQGDQMA